MLIRLTNNADKFDGNQEIPYVNIAGIALLLYDYANPNSSAPLIDITEMSLSGNQAYSEMQEKKMQWNGVDDATIVEPTLPKDKSAQVIALEQQRIRVFKVHYTMSKSSNL